MLIKIPFLRWTAKAALEIEIGDDVEPRWRLKAALDIAVKRGADLQRADLRGADLREGIKLIGEAPIIKIAPIGSDEGCLLAYKTDKGVYMQRGCFFGTRDEFSAAVEKKHGDNHHGVVYRAALTMIDAWAKGSIDDDR
jgi:hypothetical protein